MAKFFGVVGYAITEETAPGVHREKVVEREYYGDVLTNSARWQSGASLNDDLLLNSKISILADPFAYQHDYAIRYVKVMGAEWKVTAVEPAHPRLILTIGGVYNGPTET